MKYLFITLCVSCAVSVQADEQQLLELLKLKQTSAESIEMAINAGNERALLCKFCHGADGNSKKDTIPNLASQNPEYLIRQIELFARGERINRTMNDLAKLLTPDEKANIALFYSLQEVKPQALYKPELAEQGRQLFDSKCVSCHGSNAHGKQGLPRIAGQPSTYIIRTLLSYHLSVAKRAETAMSQIARALKQDEIEALTAYLTSLQ